VTFDPHLIPWWGWLLCAAVAALIASFAKLFATLVKWIAWLVVPVAGGIGAILYFWPTCCKWLVP
jgi:hypothetical protein